MGYCFSVNLRNLQPLFSWIFLLLSLFLLVLNSTYISVLHDGSHFSEAPVHVSSFFSQYFSLRNFYWSVITFTNSFLYQFRSTVVCAHIVSRFLNFYLLYFSTPEFNVVSFLISFSDIFYLMLYDHHTFIYLLLHSCSSFIL